MNYFLAISLIVIPFFASAAEWKTRILQDAMMLYAPVSLEAFKKPLQLEIRDDSLQSAAANHNHTSLDLIVYRGLLESPRLTPDGLRMIVCHELGHLFGGAPRKHVPPEWDGPIAEDGLSYLSSEGQADYYASVVCFRRMVEVAKGNEPKPDLNRVGSKLKKKCSEEAGLEGKDFDFCLRAGLGGEDFLKLTFDFPVSCEKEDSSISPELIRDSYPRRQCRLDTIVSGGLCREGLPLILDFTTSGINTCKAPRFSRPGCWYRD